MPDTALERPGSCRINLWDPKRITYPEHRFTLIYKLRENHSLSQGTIPSVHHQFKPGIIMKTTHIATIAAMVAFTVCESATASTATFIQRDTRTQGNWIRISSGAKIYGSDGYIMMGDEYMPISELPAYLTTLDMSTFGKYIWRYPGTGNPPCDLQLPFPPYTTRIASGWYYWPGIHTSNAIRVTFSDAQPHLMAIYCQDADSDVRGESIQILDATTEAQLDIQHLPPPFTDGVWLQWRVSGDLIIKVILTDAVNTAHMGFFFDADPGASYWNWLARFPFPEGANRMPTADADNDGLSNGDEFAFALNPASAGSCNPITGAFDSSSRKFSYRRPVGSGLDYVIATSENLVSWNIDAVATASQAIKEVIDGVQTVEVTVSAPAPGAHAQFARVEAR
jgi:hypothetical protein